MKEQVMAVQRMQDYIEEHLEEEITLSDLARASLFSPWHSYQHGKRMILWVYRGTEPNKWRKYAKRYWIKET